MIFPYDSRLTTIDQVLGRRRPARASGTLLDPGDVAGETQRVPARDPWGEAEIR